MIKQIPKRLLPNEAVYKEYLGNTGEGDEWGLDAPLSFVKIEEKKQLLIDENGREIIGNAKMFYDLKNSSGFNNKPVENSKIIFENKIYFIENVEILRATKEEPHHYEIMLK